MCETHARCVRLGRSGSVAKYGRFNLPGSFVPGGGRLGLKYGSCRKIRDIWQPYFRGMEKGKGRDGVGKEWKGERWKKEKGGV